MRVATWVATSDIPRLLTALGPPVVVVPCHSMSALSAAVRDGAAAAVLSSAFLAGRDVEDLAALLASCPTTVFAGLATPAWPPDGTAALLTVLGATVRLGRAGGHVFRRPIRRADWELLARSLAAARLADPVQRASVAAVLGEVWGTFRTVGGGPAETAVHSFFAAAFGPDAVTVADVAARLGVDVATLAGWFIRRRLPSVDRYVAAARLVRAAWAGEPPAPGDVAAAVGHAHPEAPARIHRAVRRLRGLATLAVRASAGWSAGALALCAYRTALMLPFRDTFRTFDPAHETAP